MGTTLSTLVVVPLSASTPAHRSTVPGARGQGELGCGSAAEGEGGPAAGWCRAGGAGPGAALPVSKLGKFQHAELEN